MDVLTFGGEFSLHTAFSLCLLLRFCFLFFFSRVGVSVAWAAGRSKAHGRHGEHGQIDTFIICEQNGHSTARHGSVAAAAAGKRGGEEDTPQQISRIVWRTVLRKVFLLFFFFTLRVGSCIDGKREGERIESYHVIIPIAVFTYSLRYPRALLLPFLLSCSCQDMDGKVPVSLRLINRRPKLRQRRAHLFWLKTPRQRSHAPP